MSKHFGMANTKFSFGYWVEKGQRENVVREG
jgi:hypothetical protein